VFHCVLGSEGCVLVPRSSGLTNLASESETCVGSWVHLVGSFHLHREEFLSAPIHSPLSSSPYRSFNLPHDTRFRQDLCKINKLELATRDNLDCSEFGYRERMTRLPCQAKDLSKQHVDHKQDIAESNQSKLGIKSVT
jgi:hypothetical protein